MGIKQNLTRVYSRILDTGSPRALYLDWSTKRKWCVDQGWEEDKDFWAPGKFNGPWQFKEEHNGMLFALVWA